MKFLDLAKQRYSSRNYKSTPIEEDKIKQILEAGRIAPSAVNNQPWFFIVIKDSNLENIKNSYHREWFNTAPLVLAICGDHSQSWKRSDGKDHCDIDVSIAIDHMTLAATELGLATCWVCNFDIEKCNKYLKLPENIELIALLSVGYPNDKVNINRHSSKRKSLEEIVRWETF